MLNILNQCGFKLNTSAVVIIAIPISNIQIKLPIDKPSTLIAKYKEIKMSPEPIKRYLKGAYFIFGHELKMSTSRKLIQI